MKGRRVITPQKKLINVNNKLGNKGVKFQQGTTKIIYDTIALDGSSELKFFANAASRDFPLTNLKENGKLGVLQSMVIERMYLTQVSFSAGTTTPTAFNGAITEQQVLGGELTVSIGNTDVIKDMPLLSTVGDYNKSAEFDGHLSFEFDTQLVIPQQLEFAFKVKLFSPAAADVGLRLTAEGVGTEVNTQQTY